VNGYLIRRFGSRCRLTQSPIFRGHIVLHSVSSPCSEPMKSYCIHFMACERRSMCVGEHSTTYERLVDLTSLALWREWSGRWESNPHGRAPGAGKTSALARLRVPSVISVCICAVCVWDYARLRRDTSTRESRAPAIQSYVSDRPTAGVCDAEVLAAKRPFGGCVKLTLTSRESRRRTRRNACHRIC